MDCPSDLSKAVDNLIKIIYSVQTSNEDKVDSYVTLFSHGQNNKEITEERLKKEGGKLLKVVKKHVTGNHKALIEAALLFLGQYLSSEGIVSLFSPEILSEILNGLINILRANQEKSVFIRCFWCLSHQKIPPVIIKNAVEELVSVFVKFCADESIKSETVINEGLKMMKRFSEQCPEEMEIHQELWIKHVFQMAVSVHREAALDVIDVSMEFLLRNQSFFQSFLLEQLNEKDLCKTLESFFYKNECPVHVLNLWACILRLLGEGFFQMDRMKVTNPLLKIAEKAFGSKSSEIKLALNNLWRALIDVVFLRPDEFQKKMEKVLLPPIKVSHRNVVIANEMLKTHWHLVCKLHKNLNEYVEKIVLPLLDVYLSPLRAAPKSMCLEKISLTTPDQIIKRKSIPRTPRSPYIASNTTKILAMEMLTQLLTEPKDRISCRGFKLECFTGPTLSTSKLYEHHEKILSYILAASETCTDKNDIKLASLWTAFLISLRGITDVEAKKNTWRTILFAIEDVIGQSILSLPLTLKIIMLTPEEILHWSFPELQTSLNTNGYVWFFILKTLFHKNLLKSDAFEQERFFILYERMIGMIFDGVSGQLQSTNMVFSLLEEKHKEINIQDVRWRLWSTLTSLLDIYISKTNDVNEGNSLEYSFATVLKALLYPLKSIDISKLQHGTIKELLAVWTVTYLNFSRAVSLLSGIELNIASEEYLKSLLFVLKNDLKVSSDNPKMYALLLQMVDLAVRNMDFTDLHQSTKSTLTPSKVAKKLANPLGKFYSFIQTVNILFVRFTNTLVKDGKISEQLVFELINTMDYFYGSVANNLVLFESIRVLVTPITKLVANRAACTPKLFMKVEKFLATVYGALEGNKNVMYTEELSSTVEPILIQALKSGRKSLITRTVKFWNITFGKNTNTAYSNGLKDALSSCNSKVIALLPGQTTDDKWAVLMESQDETAQFPDVIKAATSPKLKTKTAVAASPIKIRGSFLNSVKVEMKPQPNLFRSPAKRSSISPSNKILTSNTSKPVRRKLPLKSFEEESCTFVEIKSSPKKKRLLTDHQKEILRERKEMPAMYSNLDQSQDTWLLNSLSQDQTTQDIGPSDTNNEDVSQSILADDVMIKKNCDDIIRNELTDDEEQVKKMSSEDTKHHDEMFIVNETEDIDITASKTCDEKPNDVTVSPDVVPSSQTSEHSTSICKEGLSLIGQLRKAKAAMSATSTNGDVDESSDTSKCIAKPSELFVDLHKDIAKNSEKPDGKMEVDVLLKPVLTEIKMEPSERSVARKEIQKEAKIVLQKLSRGKVPNNKRKCMLGVGDQNKRRKSDGDILKQPSRHFKESLTGTDGFDFSQKKKISSPVAGRTRKRDQKKKNRSDSVDGLAMDVKKENIGNTDESNKRNIRTSEKKNSQENEIQNGEKVDNELPDLNQQETCATLNSQENTILNAKPDQAPCDNPVLLHGQQQQKNVLNDTSSSNTTSNESVTSTVQTTVSNPAVTFVHSASSLIVPVFTHSPTEKVHQPSSLPHSPANGILKKRLNGSLNSPSPTTKSRRVSFQLPDGMLVCKEDTDDLAFPIQQTEESFRKYTVVKKKIKDSRLADRDSKTPVYPDLVTCGAPIEKILPSLTFSRGIGHLVRAQNILTIGDLSSLSERQIENLPIRSPKLKTVRNALSTFSAHMSRERPLPKSPLVIVQPTDRLLMDTTTPPKDDTLAKEAALLATPSRHNESVKPTSLFPDDNDNSNDDKVLEESFTISDKEFDKETTGLHSVEEERTNVEPTLPESNAPKDDSMVTCSSQVHVSETNIKSVLSQIKFSSISTSIIFDLVGELDKLKATAMEELRTRMTKKSKT